MSLTPNLFALLKADSYQRKTEMLPECSVNQVIELVNLALDEPYYVEFTKLHSAMSFLQGVLTPTLQRSAEDRYKIVRTIFTRTKLPTIIEIWATKYLEKGLVPAQKYELLDLYLNPTSSRHQDSVFGLFRGVLASEIEINRYLPLVLKVLEKLTDLRDAQMAYYLISANLTVPYHQQLLNSAYTKHLTNIKDETLINYYRSHKPSYYTVIKENDDNSVNSWTLIQAETKRRGHLMRRSQRTLIRKMSIHAGEKLSLSEAQALAHRLSLKK